jgi:hypothetical protein
MDRIEIEGALRAVSDKLAGKGISGRIFIVGGAAMVLAFSSRFSTADVDADFAPADDVRDAAKTVGAELGLPEDWLNDSVTIYLPSFKEPDWRPTLKFENLEVSTADARSLLAMKMRASRGSRDIGDIRLLLVQCGIRTESDALSLYEEYFPEDPIPERATPLLRRALADNLQVS